MTVTTPTIQLYEDPTIRGRRWWILAVLSLSVIIVSVGNSSLNVTLPTLSRELGASESQLQWVIAAYALVFACLLFTTGALGDRFGRKGALQLGFVIFVTGSALASTADAMWQLIACRGLMGLGAAFIMPSTLSILINVFAPHERPRAIGIWASVVGVAGILGPVTSGFLIDHFWWGAIFLINVPICLIALVAGSIVLPKSRDPEEEPFDPGGAVLSIVGIGLVVFGLIEAPETGWTAPATLAAIGGGFVVLGIFAAWERRVRNPMLDVRYFRNRPFSAGTGVIVLTFVAMYGMTFLLTQYFQLVRGFSPIEAAIAMMPAAAMVLVFSPLSPKLCARIGDNRTVALGMSSVAVGLTTLRLADVHTSYFVILVGLLGISIGFGLSIPPSTAAIMAAVPARRAGAGSAVNNASRELGASLGVAVVGSIAASQYRSGMDSLVDRFPAVDADAARASIAGALRAATDLPDAAARAFTGAAREVFVSATHVAVTCGSLLCALGAVAAFRYLPSRPRATRPTGHDALETTAELSFGVMPMDGTEAEELQPEAANRST
jgi:MFS transporter, DHA2 family, integral membrane protein